jgi:hypothetical protein
MIRNGKENSVTFQGPTKPISNAGKFKNRNDLQEFAVKVSFGTALARYEYFERARRE